MEFMNDTIAAISTPLGEGGIGIVRLSGDNSLDIIKKIFSSPTLPRACQPMAKKTISFSDKKMVYGFISDPKTSKKIDEVMIVYFKKPRTYTGEDIIEIHGHGSIVSLNKILELALEKGARLALPGEFTKRAFLNGRIDLSQAEAVAKLIKSKTEKSLEIAMNQLEGRLSLEIKKMRSQIMNELALMEAHIDFSEEDLPPLSLEDIAQKNEQRIKKIEKWLTAADESKIFSQGVKTVITGRPNVGKSSILNMLVEKDRAIVTDIPGTTRDALYEWINLKGVPFKLVDTAGVRFSGDYVEKIGVEKTLTEVEEADIVLMVFDVSEQINEEDKKTIEHVIKKEKNFIVVLNKSDLPPRLDYDKVDNYIKKHKGIIKTSAVSGIGFDELKHKMFNLVCGGSFDTNEYLVSNTRHINLLKEAKKNLTDAQESISKNMDIDFITIDLKEAWHKLGEIIGETVKEDIVNKIFSEFCIGK